MIGCPHVHGPRAARTQIESARSTDARPGRRPTAQLHPDTAGEAQRLYDLRGMTIGQIAKAVSSSSSTVYRYVAVDLANRSGRREGHEQSQP
jgi:DNA-directed RNA polymerase specialized sigma24 family protein